MFGLNRTVCDVLEEMRAIAKTKYIRPEILLSLVEEVQFMVNRMEASLDDQKTRQYLIEEISELRKEYNSLKRDDED